MSEKTVFDFELTRLDGAPMQLDAYRGKVMLLVNTASKCGFTPQYAGLQALHERFAARGFSVIGFPCNQFGAQEPGDADEIASFCSSNYGVTFPLSARIDVNGPKADPLFAYLSSAAPGILGTEAIKWNFTKFLINRDGNIVARFAPATKPEDLAEEIEKLLA